MPRRKPGKAEPAGADVDRGPLADPESVARTIVLNKLAAQARCKQELAEALRNKAVPDEVATRVLDRFEELGLIDDADFAEQWVRTRQESRGLSRRALRMELRRKGVADELISDAVAQVDDEDELAAARRLADRKLRSMRGLDSSVQARRLVGMLARKGYPPAVASHVVRETIPVEGEYVSE